ncbi:MAG: hypothetical protein IJM45_08005, partial [Clostridia bacterium]|nr:hypothetical protein [Clostridia bacterium]
EATGEHEFEWVVYTEATCGAAGVNHEKCKNCDAVRNENTPIEATGEHEFEWVVDTEATCGTAGVKHEKCKNCDAVRNENTPIEATGEHEFEWVIDTEATCGTAGVKHEKCKNCDAVRSENTPIEATGEHEFEWVVDTEATCGTVGVKHEKCKNCDAVQSENTVIPATGNHTAGEAVETVLTEATCAADGSKRIVVTCADCGATISDTTKAIPAKGHTFGDWTVTKAATCGEAGEKTRTCSACGETEKMSVDKLEHSWGEWTDDEGSTVTCTSGGTQRRECANCGATETRDVPGGTGHSIKNPNFRGEGYCRYCGKFICDHCPELTPYEDIDTVGFIFRLVHFFIHLAHWISYHT